MQQATKFNLFTIHRSYGATDDVGADRVDRLRGQVETVCHSSTQAINRSDS